jgi:hypothetical protein
MTTARDSEQKAAPDVFERLEAVANAAITADAETLQAPTLPLVAAAAGVACWLAGAASACTDSVIGD